MATPFIDEPETRCPGCGLIDAHLNTCTVPIGFIMTSDEMLAYAVNELTKTCHNNSIRAGWWHDINTGEDLRGKRNRGEMLMLIVSEIAEAMEGMRRNLNDDKLPHRKMEEVELADALIRIFDYAGAHGYDLGQAMVEKIAFNKSRPDHKIENRKAADGKKF